MPGRLSASGSRVFIVGWQPQDDDELVALVWEVRSIASEIHSSLYQAEVIRGTDLLDIIHSGSLDGVLSVLRERYGPERVHPDPHVLEMVPGQPRP
mgnify:CR=1 FL=1